MLKNESSSVFSLKRIDKAVLLVANLDFSNNSILVLSIKPSLWILAKM
ncbi:hypothetical protein LEP1GSC172_2705 [Leptospira noguchii]|uniref:Uncharacterized protein n=1 Tax=Leptospira noguchii TaxID=28182 RepID=M6V8P7_9LEPT|nr:hypothetical protein LEP1GSC172_2705 [Leptospira noguchii]